MVTLIDGFGIYLESAIFCFAHSLSSTKINTYNTSCDNKTVKINKTLDFGHPQKLHPSNVCMYVSMFPCALNRVINYIRRYIKVEALL